MTSPEGTFNLFKCQSEIMQILQPDTIKLPLPESKNRDKSTLGNSVSYFNSATSHSLLITKYYCGISSFNICIINIEWIRIHFANVAYLTNEVNTSIFWNNQTFSSRLAMWRRITFTANTIPCRAHPISSE